MIDDLKFDLRIYVLLYGVSPLRIFLFKDGLARFATEKYVKPDADNIENMFVHLTNYAINKNNGNFVENEADSVESENDDENAHKRSLKSLYLTLKNMGYDTKKLKAQITDIIIKTIITAQPSISHTVKSCQPDDIENQLCFQVLGFDIILDSNLKPWLLEVNQSPSYATESGLDMRIKSKLIKDTLTLLNLSYKRKINCIQTLR